MRLLADPLKGHLVWPPASPNPELLANTRRTFIAAEPFKGLQTESYVT